MPVRVSTFLLAIVGVNSTLNTRLEEVETIKIIHEVNFILIVLTRRTITVSKVGSRSRLSGINE